ncbi:MAG: MoxR family ATPase [Bacteroidetes bacterium]|nr:MoxR family ATPase [Bacteroidota bacterium]MBS1629919.1 MoxR family ATPase [Bacteroidota bacterium]
METIETQASFPLVAPSLKEAIARLIVGQQDMVELMLAGLLADGHILLEGVPGVAKTLAAKVLARLLDLPFSRIQFTPDLMPGDVIGTNIFHPKTGDFQFRPGPIFSQIVLIDEINRAPAKTQAALFEVMEERQITVDGISYPMQLPFMVIATQNPIEHEGTYRLPEAQLDRFMMKLSVGYPSLNEEVEILTRQNGSTLTEQLKNLRPIITAESLDAAREQVRQTQVSPEILHFIARIVYETRNDAALYIGASPRASLAMMHVAKAIALLRGRSFVIPEDVLEALFPVLRHRISLSPEREMEGATPDTILKELAGRLEVPR